MAVQGDFRPLKPPGEGVSGTVSISPHGDRLAISLKMPGANLNPMPDDLTRVQGRRVLSKDGYGSRSQFESEVRWRYSDPRPDTGGGDAQ